MAGGAAATAYVGCCAQQSREDVEGRILLQVMS